MKTHTQMLMQVKSRKIRPAHCFRLLKSAHIENQADRIRILIPGPWRISSDNFLVTKLHKTKYTTKNISIVQEMIINRTGAEMGSSTCLTNLEYRMWVFKVTRKSHPINNPISNNVFIPRLVKMDN